MAEEAPVSRWAQRKEARRQMYLTSTEGASSIVTRKQREAMNQTQQCQKCLGIGHWTYECKNPRVYVARTSKSAEVNYIIVNLVHLY